VDELHLARGDHFLSAASTILHTCLWPTFSCRRSRWFGEADHSQGIREGGGEPVDAALCPIQLGLLLLTAAAHSALAD